jgi:hypothetical protein
MADKVYRYNFKTDLKFVLPNKKTIKVPVINTITKHFNFAINFFPIYECDCVIPMKYSSTIRQNQNSVYAILTIEKEKYKDKNTLNPESTEEILNHVFLPLFTQDSFSNIPNSTVEQGDKDGSGGTYNMAGTLTQRLKFAMYSVTGLSANKKILNYVADEADVGTMLKFLIDKTDIEGCIIDEPDNNDTYKNLIITPHNINSAIKELQVRYGIYKNGLTCFYDPPVLYVLNKFSLDHDCEKDKPNKLIFNCQVENPAVQIGVSKVVEHKDKTLSYLVCSPPFPMNQDISLSELNGNEVLFSNITLTMNMMTFEGGELKEFSYPTESILSDVVRHEKTDAKRIVDYDEINNPYNITALLKASNLGTLVGISRIIGIDPETFKPNSMVTIKVTDDDDKDAEFSGVYSLIAGSITFRRASSDGDKMISDISNIILSRMDK